MRDNARDHAHMNRMCPITLFAREKEKERERENIVVLFIYVCTGQVDIY